MVRRVKKRKPHCEPEPEPCPPPQEFSCHCVHMDVRLEVIETRIEELTHAVEHQNEKMEESKMALQDVADGLNTVTGTVDSLKTSIDTLIAQAPGDTSAIEASIVTLNDALLALKASVDAALSGGESTPATFDETVAYVVGDKVVDPADGQTYVATADSTGQVPSTSPTFWVLA